jgi:glycosyltransferase involved in cell wall biosynthesis
VTGEEVRPVKISIMIPVWNEEARLSTCMTRLLDYILREGDTDWEIVICVDGCTDRTLSIANEYAQRHSQVRVAYWPNRLGKGGGILHGLKIAKGDVIVITDVDLSASPDQILKLVSLINSGTADLAIGSRYMPESIITDKPPKHRRFLGRGFNFLFRSLFDVDLHDTQCGFKAIRANIFKDLSDKLNVKGYAFDIDLIVKALKMGCKVVEVPITWGYQKGSKVNYFLESFRMARSLLMVWYQNRKPVSLNMDCRTTSVRSSENWTYR